VIKNQISLMNLQFRAVVALEALVDKKVVVVTGGAQGIGLAICRRAAETGAAVAIIDLDGQRAKQAAESVGGTAIGYSADVTDYGQLSEVAQRVATDLGVPTALVANVGWTPDRYFLENTLEEQERIIAVNYTGSLHSTRLFLPGMIEAGHGRIVYISSDAARAGVAREAVYAGAKAALIGFAKSLAVEVGRSGVTVNVVCPGSTDTPLLRAMFTEEQIQKRIRIHPMRRLARPEDVAAVVSFFISEEAGFVNGQVISASGGMLRAG
jgi:2-hydroxycyclohexanecarboxyl-CoA dehydrogenase